MSRRAKEGADDPKRSYFFDNCVSSNLVKAMRCLDVDARHLQEAEFRENADDVDWIPSVVAKGWIIITSDRRITVVDHERAALKTAKATAFFLPKHTPRKSRWDQALFIFKAWPNIEKIAAYARPGDCYDVHENGTVAVFAGL